MRLKNIALKIIKFYKIWENKCRENFCLSGNSFKKFENWLFFKVVLNMTFNQMKN